MTQSLVSSFLIYIMDVDDVVPKQFINRFTVKMAGLET